MTEVRMSLDELMTLHLMTEREAALARLRRDGERAAYMTLLDGKLADAIEEAQREGGNLDD